MIQWDGRGGGGALGLYDLVGWTRGGGGGGTRSI